MSTVSIKTDNDIAGMREAGRLAAEVLEMIEPLVEPGISTGELDRICHDHIVNVQKAIPAPLNYKGFPKSICTSVNDVICHGIPSDTKVLKQGDIINIDVTVIKDGYHGDTSRTFFVGTPSPLAKRLVEVTEKCLMEAIKTVKPGSRIGDIGAIIQECAEPQGFSVVRDFVGHGVSKVFHTAPQIPHYGKRGKGKKLRSGMVFTIEPMINEGTWEAVILKDGWTAITKDRKLSAQFEHTIAVTETGVEILTLSD